MSDPDAAIKAVRDEALRKIGRNVVLFQQLEGILKFLAAAQHPSMPLGNARASREERSESIHAKTLGQVARQVVEELFADSDAESSAPAGIAEPWLAFSFRIAGDAADIEESRKTLKALIDERNDLVHGLLSRWNLRDADSCFALSTELDEQRSRIVVEIGRYRAYADTLREAAKELQAFIDSDDGKRHLDVMFLQSSRLALKREHGEGSLHKLVAAIDLFDIQSENTPNGGTRAVYRTRT